MKKVTLKTIYIGSALSVLTLAMFPISGAHAQRSSEGGENSGQQQQRKGPPPEAFTVCSGSSVGGSCTVSTPRGDMSGTCEMPRGDKLVCVPEGRGDRSGQK